jgi:O-antigen biosynthesis protein
MLVSCIMPTRGRQAFALEALACYRAQTWDERELVIVDDADDRSFPEGVYLYGVQYHLLEKRLTIGAKRNIACSRARGSIIAHFDDDDWSAPERLEDQVIRMVNAGKGVTGYRSMRFTDGVKWWQYTGAEDYALGTSLVYTREYWARNPFKTECIFGEDSHFIWAARRSSDIVTVDAGSMMWARNHAGNTDPRSGMSTSKQWREIECPAFV